MSRKLLGLHTRIAALSWRRWLFRTCNGALAVAFVLGLILAITFAFDWHFRWQLIEREIQLVAIVAVVAWSVRKFVWPELKSRESVVQLALQVERRQRIDSDLVAALEFDSPHRSTWGSPELSQAVVDRVANLGSQLSLSDGFDDVSLRRRGIPLALVVITWVAFGVLYPRQTTAFFDRLRLGSAHYPTRTTISRIEINGVEAFPALKPGAVVRVPHVSSLKFEIEATGEIPSSGEVRLRSGDGAETTSVLLLPNDDGRQFSGEFTRTAEEVGYQIFLGDAWSEPGTIRVILPPVVSMQLDHTPPPYAAKTKSTRTAAGSRQISVMEGSSVQLTLRSANKPLTKAELVVDEVRFPLVAKDEQKQLWSTASGTPFDQVNGSLAFEVLVVDVDGLAPELPIRGQIHIHSDRPPRVAGAIVTEKVLPGARPSITWGAADDNGLAEIRLVKQVTRASGEVVEAEELVQKVSPDKQPLPTLRGKHVVDLKPLGLAKGDEVRVTLLAIDYRGDRPGISASSETIIFTVTDESGILAGLVEADEKSARQLDQIIQRQLGIGENR